MESNLPSKNPKGIRSIRSRKEDIGLLHGKVPPQAPQLEEAIIGALMLDKDALPVVIDILSAESFYREAHQKIFAAMLSLFEQTLPIDMLTVAEALRKAGELEVIGGPFYLVELTNRVASAANIEYHARLVAQKHIQRELIRVSTKTIQNAFEDTTDVFELLDQAEQGLFDITQNNLNRSYESMDTLAAKLKKELDELRNKKDGLTGVPTGFTEIDRLTSGFQRSDLIIIAARPGMGKCLGKGTKVLMFSGELKEVEAIKVGDLLMGADSKARRVLSIATGQEQMYWIRQNKGIDYRVNESHILSLKKSRTAGRGDGGEVLNISVKDYLDKSNKFKSNYKGYKVGVEFDAQKLPIAPYFLGIWLGDGTQSNVAITTLDKEVVEYLHDFASTISHTVSIHQQQGKTPQYSVVGGNREPGNYSLQGHLRAIGVLNNKHIPNEYLINSADNRLELLAGLIDSDGHYLVQSNGYEIAQKNKALAHQIKFLCDSLGFRTSLEAKKVSIAAISYEITVWRIRIYGDIDKIPVRIQRKKGNPWKSIVDWQVTSIEIERDIVDDYYGFELDGNGLFLLEDMTVTHNTSFVLSLARNAAVDFQKAVAIFSLEMSSTQLASRLVSLEAEISGHKLRNAQLESDEWDRLNQCLEKISEVPIFIDDTPGLNIFELRAKCRRLKMQNDIQLVVIDYLQLMSGGSSNQKGNREQEVSAISRSLKALAKEINVPVIALSQLSRAVEVRGGTKRPQLSDLRESGCLTGDTILIHAETGAPMTIKSLANRTEQVPIPVIAMGNDLKLSSHLMTKAFPSGVKKVYELKTRTGSVIKASANHPFKKLNKWVRLDELKVGDRIAVARNIPIAIKDSKLSTNELILIAHLLGDGCILPRQAYHYTSANPTNIEIVNRTANALFGINAKVVQQENWWHTYLKSLYHLTHGKKHPITKWYDQLGIERVPSYRKVIPEGVFMCTDEDIALFLTHLWATDGNVSWEKSTDLKKSAAIYYASSSEVLVRQVQHLLLRLNIKSTIKRVGQGKHRDNFHLAIQGSANQLKFLDLIGCYGSKGDVIPEMKVALQKIEANSNYDVIPKEAWEVYVKPSIKKHGLSQATFANKLGIAKSSATYKTGISRKRLAKVNTILEDKHLDDLAKSDLLWDEIMSITYVGEEEVYDVTIPSVSNFLANDIIVHNSIEQDADMVAFIYRPEYYDIIEDEEGMSLKGVAELIFAKNRHGATKTINLKFTDQFAKFSDLDDFSLSDFGIEEDSNAPGGTSEANYGNIQTIPSKMNDDEDIPF